MYFIAKKYYIQCFLIESLNCKYHPDYYQLISCIVFMLSVYAYSYYMASALSTYQNLRKTKCTIQRYSVTLYVI